MAAIFYTFCLKLPAVPLAKFEITLDQKQSFKTHLLLKSFFKTETDEITSNTQKAISNFV